MVPFFLVTGIFSPLVVVAQVWTRHKIRMLLSKLGKCIAVLELSACKEAVHEGHEHHNIDVVLARMPLGLFLSGRLAFAAAFFLVAETEESLSLHTWTTHITYHHAWVQQIDWSVPW